MTVRFAGEVPMQPHAEFCAMRLAAGLESRIREYVLRGHLLQQDEVSCAQRKITILQKTLPEDSLFLQRLLVVSETAARLLSPTLFAGENREFAALVACVDKEMAVLAARVLCRVEFLCESVALRALEACKPLDTASLLNQLPDLRSWVRRQDLKAYPSVKQAVELAFAERPLGPAVNLRGFLKGVLLRKLGAQPTGEALKKWLISPSSGYVAERIQAACEVEGALNTVLQFTTNDWADLLENARGRNADLWAPQSMPATCGIPSCLLPLFLTKPKEELQALLTHPRLQPVFIREWEQNLPKLLAAAYSVDSHWLLLTQQIYCASLSEDCCEIFDLMDVLAGKKKLQTSHMTPTILPKLVRLMNATASSCSALLTGFVEQRCTTRFSWLRGEALFWGVYLTHVPASSKYLNNLQWSLEAMNDFALYGDAFPDFKKIAYKNFAIELYVQNWLQEHPRASSPNCRELMHVLDAFDAAHPVWKQIDWSAGSSAVCYLVFPKLTSKQLRAYAASDKKSIGGFEHYSVHQARQVLEERKLSN